MLIAATAGMVLPVTVAAGRTATVVSDADCKSAVETATGGSPDHALQNWVSLTSALYGARWADWQASRDSAVVSLRHNGFVVYRAVAIPCRVGAAR
jgi:hypothetical protein